MPVKPSTLRNRNLTAAKRSLKLILEGAQSHLDVLDGGGVPESSFAPSVTKYLEALGNLRVLDALEEPGGNGEGWLATVEVSRDDLDILIGVLRQSDLAIAIEQAGEGSPLGNILAVLDKGEVPGD